MCKALYPACTPDKGRGDPCPSAQAERERRKAGCSSRGASKPVGLTPLGGGVHPAASRMRVWLWVLSFLSVDLRSTLRDPAFPQCVLVCLFAYSSVFLLADTRVLSGQVKEQRYSHKGLDSLDGGEAASRCSFQERR